MARPGSPTLSDADSADFTSVHWASSTAAPAAASAPAAHQRPTSSMSATTTAGGRSSGRTFDSPLTTTTANPLAAIAAPAVEDDHTAVAAAASAATSSSAAAAGSSTGHRVDADGDNDNDDDRTGSPGGGQGWVGVRLVDYKKEVEGGKESYVSYGIRTKTNLPTYPLQDVKVRRRFQDFTFLSDQLARDFPACIVPPLPSKSRIEYLPGRDRFAPEFIEKRIEDLQRFLTRLTLHPILRRAQLLIYFLTATSDWAVKKHKHLAATTTPQGSILDTIGDSLVHLTQGSKVRKVDERFEAMREEVERFEFGLAGLERGTGRLKGRTNDLGNDYEDLARSVRQLGLLESGMTDPLGQFAERLESFGDVLQHLSSSPLPPLQAHLHSLQAYAQAHHTLLALRAQKQLDVEILTEYLSSVVLERDRLAALVELGVGAGSHAGGGVGPPVGVGAWARERIEKIRGKDDVHSRRVRMGVLDGKIAELQDAVLSTHQTSERFSAATAAEHATFELVKRTEMKDLLGGFVDGQVELYQKAIDDWDALIPRLEKVRV